VRFPFPFDEHQGGIDERKLRIVLADHVPLPPVGKHYFEKTFSAIPVYNAFLIMVGSRFLFRRGYLKFRICIEDNLLDI
jgi:hypothetical protein